MKPQGTVNVVRAIIFAAATALLFSPAYACDPNKPETIKGRWVNFTPDKKPGEYPQKSGIDYKFLDIAGSMNSEMILSDSEFRLFDMEERGKTCQEFEKFSLQMADWYREARVQLTEIKEKDPDVHKRDDAGLWLSKLPEPKSTPHNGTDWAEIQWENFRELDKFLNPKTPLVDVGRPIFSKGSALDAIIRDIKAIHRDRDAWRKRVELLTRQGMVDDKMLEDLKKDLYALEYKRQNIDNARMPEYKEAADKAVEEWGTQIKGVFDAAKAKRGDKTPVVVPPKQQEEEKKKKEEEKKEGKLVRVGDNGPDSEVEFENESPEHSGRSSAVTIDKLDGHEEVKGGGGNPYFKKIRLHVGLMPGAMDGHGGHLVLHVEGLPEKDQKDPNIIGKIIPSDRDLQGKGYNAVSRYKDEKGVEHEFLTTTVNTWDKDKNKITKLIISDETANRTDRNMIYGIDRAEKELAEKLGIKAGDLKNPKLRENNLSGLSASIEAVTGKESAKKEFLDWQQKLAQNPNTPPPAVAKYFEWQRKMEEFGKMPSGTDEEKKARNEAFSQWVKGVYENYEDAKKVHQERIKSRTMEVEIPDEVLAKKIPVSDREIQVEEGNLKAKTRWISSVSTVKSQDTFNKTKEKLVPGDKVTVEKARENLARTLYQRDKIEGLIRKVDALSDEDTDAIEKKAVQEELHDIINNRLKGLTPDQRKAYSRDPAKFKERLTQDLQKFNEDNLDKWTDSYSSGKDVYDKDKWAIVFAQDGEDAMENKGDLSVSYVQTMSKHPYKESREVHLFHGASDDGKSEKALGFDIIDRKGKIGIGKKRKAGNWEPPKEVAKNEPKKEDDKKDDKKPADENKSSQCSDFGSPNLLTEAHPGQALTLTGNSCEGKGKQAGKWFKDPAEHVADAHSGKGHTMYYCCQEGVDSCPAGAYLGAAMCVDK